MKQWLRANFHKVALIFWISMIIPTIVWWKDSILWVSIMSLYANIWISVEVFLNRES